MTEATTTDDAPARLSIVDGHVRPEPIIETGIDPKTGTTVITSETHFAARPVHFAVDPSTGLVYAGYAPHEALGIDPPEEDQSAADAQREYEEFRAWRAANANGAVTVGPAVNDDAGSGVITPNA